jgi:hypothetical protein
MDSASPSSKDGKGCCSVDEAPERVEAALSTLPLDFHASEIAVGVAYHSCVGLVLASGPLFASAVLLSRLTCREDDLTDEELMASRPREVLGAAQATRLQALKSRKAKTPAEDQTSGHESTDPAHGAACAVMSNSRNPRTEPVDEAEVCAVCQMHFEARAEVLACRHCDSGFHVRCLNRCMLQICVEDKRSCACERC